MVEKGNGMDGTSETTGRERKSKLGRDQGQGSGVCSAKRVQRKVEVIGNKLECYVNSNQEVYK